MSAGRCRALYSVFDRSAPPSSKISASSAISASADLMSPRRRHRPWHPRRPPKPTAAGLDGSSSRVTPKACKPGRRPPGTASIAFLPPLIELQPDEAHGSGRSVTCVERNQLLGDEIDGEQSAQPD